jgi:iron(III) transport system ATP-binding protein
MAAVSLQGIHKAFGATPVICGVDLEVPSGARCVLLGPSGCGKTTTLRMVAGLDEPDTGHIVVGGQTVANPGKRINIPPERRGLGMVFQSYALWPHLSVGENVAYPLRRARLSAGEVRQRVEEALALVHLTGLGARLPHMLSGGQQQRVALARALAARPPVLLADEPLSNLDARLRDGLRVELAALCQAHGITLIHVTHDQAEALALATLVVVMQAGRVAQQGPPQEVYRAPHSLYVATFLGDTAVLQARCVASGGVALGGLGIPGVRVVDARAGGPCALAVRPEDVALSNAADTLRGKVLLSSCVGPHHVLEVETAYGNLRVTSEAHVPPGTPVGLELRGGHAFAPAAAG